MAKERKVASLEYMKSFEENILLKGQKVERSMCKEISWSSRDRIYGGSYLGVQYYC